MSFRNVGLRRRSLVDLSLERLERRLLLTTLTGAGVDVAVSETFTDASGDLLQAEFYAPEGATVEILDASDSDPSGTDVATIEFTGTDMASEFYLWDTDTGNGDDIDIGSDPGDGISTDGSADMGLIALGFNDSGVEMGTVSFGTGSTTDVNGRLGAQFVNGALDFDDGDYSITADGNIGMIWAEEVTLDSTSGQADITAGPAGAGNISVMASELIFDSTGGDEVDGQIVTPGNPLTVADDAGTGGSGSLRFAVGPGGTAEVVAVPVVGGGSVVTSVIGEGTVRVQGIGSGGDIGMMDLSNQADSSAIIRGSRDIDVGILTSDTERINSFVNRSPGGDLLVGVTGSINRMALGQQGNLGALMTGPNNSQWLFPQMRILSEEASGNGLTAGLDADGDVGLIRTGSVVNATVNVTGNVGTIDAGRGGLVNSNLDVGGNLGRLIGDFAHESTVQVDGSGNLLRMQRAGIFETDVNYEGGLLRAHLGTASESSLTSVNGTSGGRIERFSARDTSDFDLEAFEGFGSIHVPGQVVDTDITSRVWDGTEYVGGGANRVRLGNVVDMEFEVQGDVGLFRSGAMHDDTEISIHGDLRSGRVQGSMSESEFDIEGSLTGSLIINGDPLDDSAEITIVGDSNLLIVRGSTVVGDGIEIGGNSRRLILTGGHSESGGIDIGGNSGYLRVGFMDDGSDIDIGGNSGTILVGTLSDYSDIDITGNSRLVRVDRAIEDSDIDIEGDSRRILIGESQDSEVDVGGDSGLIRIGRMMDGDDIYVGGNANRIILRDVSHIGDIEVDGNLNFARVTSVAGGAIDGDSEELEVGGNLGRFVMTGGITEFDVDVEGDVTGGLYFRGNYSDLDVEVDGFLPRMIVNGDYDDGDIEADAGFGTIRISGLSSDVDIESEAFEGGLPIGGGLRRLVVGESEGMDIDLHGDLGTMIVNGAADDLEIDLAHDNGTLFGGSLGRLSVRGLSGSSIETFGRINRVRVGSGGLDADTTIETLDSDTGHLGSLRTTGLILGDIRIAGDANTVRHDGLATVPVAPQPSPLDDSSTVDYIFTDRGGAQLGSTLAVDGVITGVVG